jgi:hypothetical protein
MFSFEDVLGMASVFSEQACPSLKIEYAFRIYGGCSGGLRREGKGHRIPSTSETQSPQFIDGMVITGVCLNLYGYVSCFSSTVGYQK